MQRPRCTAILQIMRNRPLLLLTTLFLFSFLLLAYPIYVIRPFRYQGPGELAAALLVTTYRSGIEIVCALLAVLIVIVAWRSTTVLRRFALAGLAILVIVCGALSHINVYEKMFYPIDRPTFAAAAQSKLDPAEVVIAVRVNDAARAYPIRDISYHHIVNDTLGGRAIVATY
jgi:hypothetical protein